jgi:hypothetical protein
MYVVKLKSGNLSIVNSLLNIPQLIKLPQLTEIDFVIKKTEYDNVEKTILSYENKFHKYVNITKRLDFYFFTLAFKYKDGNRGYIWIGYIFHTSDFIFNFKCFKIVSFLSSQVGL